MRAVVKIVWKKGKTPMLKLASEEGYSSITLTEGRSLDLELKSDRRCVGYHSSVGEMTPCPDFELLSSGSQCGACREKDIYTDFRRGNSGKNLDSKFSVYLAQCGSNVKVGVTRTERLYNRWLEQGAVYAVEIYSNLSAEEALEKESDLSSNGIKERIRKENKIEESKELISDILEQQNLKGNIKQICEPLNCRNLRRKGVFPRNIRNVCGQIVSDGRECLALGSGKVIVASEQQSLDNF